MKFTQEQKAVVEKRAKELGVEYAALAAVIQVESNGVAGSMIGNRFEPTIRYEGHYFDKLCPPSVRDAARKAGVSAKEAGVIKNPASQVDRWKLVLKATSFDTSAAYQSVSYGVGQVMGSHWKVLGFKSVDDLVSLARSGFDGQVQLMIKFIKHFGLADELERLDWSGFARGYNGKNYRKNAYDTNMAKAYVLHGGSSTLPEKVSGTLRLGSKGAGVRDVQALLNAAGFMVHVDGDFGPDTKKMVEAFQKKNALTVDGIVGPRTQEMLSVFRAVNVDKPGQPKIFDIDLVKKGTTIAVGIPATVTAAKETVEGVVTQLSPYTFLSPLVQTLTNVVGVLTLASIAVGAGVAVYGWYKSKKTDTGTKSNVSFFTANHDADVEDFGPITLPPSTGTSA